jgi:hypothetical protein
VRLLAAMATTVVGVGCSALTTTVRPLSPEFVSGERRLVLIAVANESSRSFSVPEGEVSWVWQHRREDGRWEECQRESGFEDIALLPSRVSFQAPSEVPPGESRVLGLAGPGCIEVDGSRAHPLPEGVRPPSVYQVRLSSESRCCRTSESVEIRIVPGGPADARARIAEERSAHTDSILAGWEFLRWIALDRLYEDPVFALQDGSYAALRGEKLLPGIARMQAFLRNFPSFPFAATIRLRLATELAIVGRTAEARAELQKFSGTPQEPHVEEDARALLAALEKGPAAKDGSR